MKDAREGCVSEFVRLRSQIVRQVAIEVFDFTRGITSPDLLGNGLGKLAKLAFAFENFGVGTLQLGRTFLDANLEDVPRGLDSRLASPARRTDGGDGNGTDDKPGHVAAKF